MRSIFIFPCIILLLIGCNTKPMVEKDGGLIVSLTYNPNNPDAKKELQVIKNRIADCKLIIEEFTVDSVGNTIVLKIPAYFDSISCVYLCGKTGNFSIVWSYDNTEIFSSLVIANHIVNDLLDKQDRNSKPKEKKKTDIPLLDKIQASEQNEAQEFDTATKYPIFKLLNPNISIENQPNQGALIGYAKQSDTALISEYLRNYNVKRLFPMDLAFLWSVFPRKYSEEKLFELYAAKISRNGSMVNINSNIKSSEVKTDAYGYTISVSFDKVGAKVFSRVTKENINKFLPILIDNKVIICPKVMSQIDGGKLDITSGTDKDENQLKVFSSLLKNNYEIRNIKIKDIKVVKSKKMGMSNIKPFSF